VSAPVFAPAAGRHLFLTQTVYHFILSAGIAAQARRVGGSATVLFIRDFDRAGEFLDAVRAWPSSPFEAVVDLGGYERQGSRGTRRRSSARLADEIAAHGRRLAPAAVHVFNDRHEFAQMLIEEVAAAHPGADRVHVEDGTAAYSNKRFKPRNLVQRIERRWRYGRRWTDLLCLGTHPLVQQRVLLFPGHARRELRERGGLRAYPLDDLRGAGLASLAGALAGAAGYGPERVAGVTLIFAIASSHIQRRVPDYRERTRALLAELRRQGLGVAFKYHPREHEGDFVGARDFYPDGEVPRGLPIEFVTLLADARPRLLLADFSTSLLLSPLLNPAVRGAAFITPGFDDHGLQGLYEGARLPVLSSARAVVEFCARLGAPVTPA
jgi:hypothetical protein